MIWGQIIWGLILAGLLGFTFRRAWRWEHGEAANVLFSKKYGKETFVFVPPTVLFWILLVFLVMFVWGFGVQDGLLRFAAHFADVLLLLSVYYVLLLLVLPLLRKRFSARACAVLWLVPAFLSWQSNTLISLLPMPRYTLHVPRRLFPAIGLTWLMGFLAVGGYYLISHLLFSSWVHKNTTEEGDTEVCALWEKEREKLDYRRPVKLLRGNVSAPFSMGQTKRSRCTVLPNRNYTPEELSLIFRHELHHLQRCDVNTKVFLCLCNALLWFNPLVWIATRKAAEDLELSCDEIVTESMRESERRTYAKLLLDSAAQIRGCTTCLSAAAGTLRYRLKGVMDRRRRLLGTVVLMVAIFCCVMSFGIVSISDERGSFTSMVLVPNVEIAKIHDSSYSTDDIQWDDVALRKVLDEVDLEHIAGLRNPVLDGQQITFLLSDGRFATFTEQLLVINDFHRYNSVSDCYLITSTFDWDTIFGCFK